MSNSKLVNYTKISPNRGNYEDDIFIGYQRLSKIDTITIHCVVGQCSVETLGDIFYPTSKDASSNYGIGYDGRIGMYCEEKDRSWCSSSSSNDNRAITIEVASDTTHPYAVNEKAYAALLDLVTDICKRNGIKKLLWKADESLIGQIDKQNMTVHRWFDNKSCPGEYLYSHHSAIAEAVNKRLGTATETPSENAKTLYKVQIGAFSKRENAETLEKKLKSAGFDTYILAAGKYFKVQVGAFSVKSNAESTLAKMKNAGYSDAFIVSASSSVDRTPAMEIGIGSYVRLKNGAKTYTGESLASFVYTRNHKVKEISGDRAVITYNGVVVAAVKVSDLTLV